MKTKERKPEIYPDNHLQMSERMVKENEGLCLKVYEDTVGKMTIGYGRNLDDRGITWEEAKLMLAHDLVEAHNELYTQFAFFRDLSDPRKAVMTDMLHNLGLTRLLTFKKMLTAVQHGNFDDAAAEIRDSRYWDQVGSRAQRNFMMMKFDKYFTKQEAKSYFTNQGKDG